MTDFVRVASASSIPDPGRITVQIDERMVVLLHVAGEFFCLDDVCTHDGGPLGDGQLVDHRLACPRHGAFFDIRTGKALTMPATEATVCHDVQVVGDDVMVRLADE